MFKDNDFSKLRVLKINDKDVYVVDRHQYVMPLWASKSLESNETYELVSIDYHPDTNPPFWQKAYFKAVNENRDEDESYISDICKAMVSKVDSNNLLSMPSVSDRLNNDEHINTAMSLGYISDYHMINCMDNHIYTSGRHYLLDEKYFSSLKDEMFISIKFQVPKLKFILDIDLDYFLDIKSFFLNESSDEADDMTVFKRLVKECEFITIARSIKYFNYLKRDDFDIEECENMMLEMINKILG